MKLMFAGTRNMIFLTQFQLTYILFLSITAFLKERLH